METISSGILHQKYVTLSLSIAKKWTCENTSTGSFPLEIPLSP